MPEKKISFVIPCYNCKNTIQSVVESIKSAFQGNTKFEYEIILVNDGSRDNTLSVIADIARHNLGIKAIDLSRNFGQHNAIMAGFSQATGEIIIGMDDDGEHDGRDAFKLIDRLEEGFDYVCARYPVIKKGILKTFGSKMNNFMATMLIGKPKEITLTSFYAMKRYVVDEILRYKNAFPYIAGLMLRTTKNISTVDIEHHDRASGKSGYTLRRSLGLWFNGFTAFSVVPLRFSTLAGALCAAFGFMLGLYTVIHKILNPATLAGYSSLMAALLFIGGMLMLMLGMIGEYIGRIYISINNSPQYVIRETINLDQADGVEINDGKS